MRRFVTAATLCCALALPTPTHAQDDDDSCAGAAADVTRLYAEGAFDEAIKRAGSCLRRMSRKDQLSTYESLAKAYLAEGQFADAETAVGDLIRRNAEFRASPNDPALFADLVNRARRTLVRSVSKLAEDWREAPATVAVVTAEEIERRGYRSVEAVLHDLPGFDISRTNGDSYATIYQRGYRSNSTDRTLVLVDGLEQNDLHSNIAYISRQYPLSAIERIEVVYGPASTLYGPNAFSGVINIITREPDTMVAEGRHVGARVVASAGTFKTGYTEGVLAGISKESSASWSIVGRVFRSDEMNLSQEQSWRYGYPAAFADIDYGSVLRLEGKTLDRYLCARQQPGSLGHVLEHPERCVIRTAAADALLGSIGGGLTTLADDGHGALAIVPTAQAIQRARALDTGLFQQLPFLTHMAFHDPSTDWFLSAKAKFSDFTFGVQSWRNREGTSSSFTDWARGDNGLWTPRQTSIFASFAKPLNSNLALNVLLRYKNDQVDASSTVPLMATYASGYLDLLNLLSNAQPAYRSFNFDQVSTQFRTEITAVYQRSERVRAIAGADVRDSSVQAQYFVAADAPLYSFGPNPTPEEIKATDVGVFGEGSFTAMGRLKFVGGLRFDDNETRENERVTVRVPGASAPTVIDVDDFGKFVSPRAAVIATLGGKRDKYLSRVPGQVILKAVYSRASQQPSNFQRFATEPFLREYPSPFLGREKATNAEFSFGWEPRDGTRFELAKYRVNYSDVLHTVELIDPCCIPTRTGQFQSIGRFHVTGYQATGSYRRGTRTLFANYTYTEAVNSGTLRDEYGAPLAFEGEVIQRLPIGDIARHKFNVGATAHVWTGVDASLRLNVVGRRPTGPATTVRLNLADVPAYATVNATVGYRDQPRGLSFQLGIDNLFDSRYWDPGVRSAQLFGFAGRVPQPGISAFATASWDFNFAKSTD